MNQSELNKILDKHIKWLNDEEGGERADLHYADLSGANLCAANLRSADLRSANLCTADLCTANLRSANLRGANLRSADLSGANLCGANLRSADLRSANLRSANLCGADLSCALGLQSSSEFMENNFSKTQEGYIVYKTFGAEYNAPKSWKIEEDFVLTENTNSNRAEPYGCGINVAPLEWVKRYFPNRTIYKLLIKWEWLPGVVVPYNSDGKIRCEKAMIIGKVEEDEMV